MNAKKMRDIADINRNLPKLKDIIAAFEEGIKRRAESGFDTHTDFIKTQFMDSVSVYFKNLGFDIKVSSMAGSDESAIQISW